MAENGILDYQGMNQAIYRGATSNIVVDTQSMSIEIGAGNTSHTSNLHFECNHDANVASIKLNSNVVTEFPRSKKLIKYPRVAMTSASQDGYVVTSYEGTTNGAENYNAFNGIKTGTDRWSPSATAYTSGSWNNTQSNGATQDVNGNIWTGEWLQIQLPNKIALKMHIIQSRSTHTYRLPKKGVILGSNTNGTTWNLVDSWSGLISETEREVSIDDINYYDYYRLVSIELETGDADAIRTDIQEWELYGLPEYDPEAYGTDVTIKSVPNVPNTDWLEVYYDAKDLADGAVTSVDDLTPSGTNDGTATNVTVSDGAFVFNGTNSNVTTGTTLSDGAYPHSVSLWYYTNDDPSALADYLFQLGDNTENNSPSININGATFYLSFFGNYLYNTVASTGIQTKKWVQISYSYDGGPTTANNPVVYIDGKQITMYGPLGNSAGSALSLVLGTDPNVHLTIGSRRNGTLPVNGKIANFRLFNRAITSDEAWQLYSYQKEYFGHGDLSMTLKAGRLGIGTSEPKALLDVGGEPFGPGSRPGFLVSVKSNVNRQFGASNSTHTTLYSSPLPIFLAGELKYNISNCLSFHDYAGRKYIKFTAPANGIYNFGLALGHTRNIHSQSDYIGFGLMVNKEGAYTTAAGSNYTELDYYFTEYEASKMFPVDAQITMNGNINIQLNKSDFVVYYSRSVENVELISTYSAWGHIVQYL